jgi:general secretion pathway protein K
MRNDGYVTLAVLLMVGMLAALVSSLLALARPAVDLARIGADDLRLDGLLQGGVTAAGYLLYAAAHNAEAVDGMTLRFDEGTARLAVIDESGRIDLNRADPELLSGLFSAVRGTSLSPTSFAARIADWRDTDEETAEQGAEAEDYTSAGLNYGPSNGSFRSVEEMRLILGLSAQDFDRLKPFVTVFNLSGMVDPFSAAPTVLSAIPDIGKNDIKKLVGAHGAPPEVREQVLEQLENYSDYFLFEPSGIYRVRIEAELPGGRTDTAEAVLTGPSEERPDHGILSWSRPAAGELRLGP